MTLLKRNSRLFGDLEAELIDRHLHIIQRPLFGKARAFKIDVACLSPEPLVERAPAREWLLAAVVTALVALIAIYGASHGIAPVIMAGLGALFTLAAIITALVYRVRSARSLLLITRHAHQILVRIRPYPKENPDINNFMQALLAKVGEVESKRRLDAQQLRSGEIRTLRRLCNESIVTEAEYESAKRAVFSAPH